MADISFNCPHCSQHFEAPPDMAGDKLPCPTCEKEITVPVAEPTKPSPTPKMVTPAAADKPPAPQSVAPPSADKPPAPQSMAPPAKAPSLKIPGKAPKPTEEDTAAGADGADKCPECQADLAPGAAICIQCGFNLKTGQKLGTDIKAAPAAAEEEKASDG